MVTLLTGVLVIAASCAALRWVARHLRQPPVIGELAAGILLGPTLLGSWSATLFPHSVRPLLADVGNLGVALFMFTLGAELRFDRLRGRVRNAWAIALGSLAVSFAVGIGTALAYRPDATWPFILFVGVALSVTAFPVLARILTDRGLTRTDVGALAMAVAAVTDVFCWSVLALVMALADPTRGGLWRLGLLAPLVLVLRYAAVPVLRVVLAAETPTWAVPLVVIGGAVLCGLATDAIGLHVIVGSFLFGLVVGRAAPRDRSALARVHTQAERSGRVLMPVYFTMAGLAVDVRFDAGSLALAALLFAVATIGKAGGTFVVGRACRIPLVPAAALAVLMNTRGLTELVVLTTGRQLGLIDPRLYSTLVLVALATTVITGPLIGTVVSRNRRLPDDQGGITTSDELADDGSTRDLAGDEQAAAGLRVGE